MINDLAIGEYLSRMNGAGYKARTIEKEEVQYLQDAPSTFEDSIRFTLPTLL